MIDHQPLRTVSINVQRVPCRHRTLQRPVTRRTMKAAHRQRRQDILFKFLPQLHRTLKVNTTFLAICQTN